MNSNSSVGVPLQQPNKMYKTSSSNLQLSELTLSLLKDNGGSLSLVGYNSNQNLAATKNFVETDAFEIKEEDEEQCCTPLAQFEQHQKES